MIICDNCGAANDAGRIACRVCGGDLGPAGDPIAPLPPIPDGGLGTTMPGWLREPDAPTAPPMRSTRREPAARDGAVVDPRTFLTEDDLPEWIRRLAGPPTVAASPPAPVAAARGEEAPRRGAVRRQEPAQPARPIVVPDEAPPAPRAAAPYLLPVWLVVAGVVVAIAVLVLLLLVSSGTGS